MNPKIGSKIQALRKQKGWSQEQTAELLHMSQSSYARMESGKSSSWTIHLKTICTLFEIEPQELLIQDVIKAESIKNTKAAVSNDRMINQFSEKLIAQYELRIKEKDTYITKLEQLLKQK